jgi:hypothetical protein
MTNVSSDVLNNVPRGTTYQSVIEFAPMARNEPLSGMSQNGSALGGTGGAMPCSSGNGLGFGYSIGGAADSENSYLVEGQDTENISAGYSKANVPMEFIQEVQVKTSGIYAEYGGALGGVVNVSMHKGSNEFHGQLFSSYESSGTDGNPVNAFLRYNPLDSGNAASGLDPAFQIYQPQKDHFRTIEPGITVGGPIMKDRVWFFAGFEPLVNSQARSVNFGVQDSNAGQQYFTRDKQTYFGTLRVDAKLNDNFRVFGSWLDQYARETGDSLPIGDPVASESTYLNTSIYSPLSNFSHGLGWSAPNSTYNFGADITLSPKVVATTRYGYFFENYHDFGWPTTAPDLNWLTNGQGALDNSGKPLPANLQQPAGASTTPYLGSYTLFNASKHYQLNQDIAFYKSGWAGTHNFKSGQCDRSEWQCALRIYRRWRGSESWGGDRNRRSQLRDSYQRVGRLRWAIRLCCCSRLFHHPDFTGQRLEPCALRPGFMDDRARVDPGSRDPRREGNPSRSGRCQGQLYQLRMGRQG